MGLIKNNKMNVAAALSAIPLTMAIQMVDSPLKWFMLMPVFYLCIGASLKQIISRAVIFGMTASILNFFWLVGSANNYTGTGYLLGIGLILAFACVFSLYSMLVGVVYYYLLRWQRNTKWEWVYVSFSGGSFFVLLDFGMEYIGKGFATCLYTNYIPFADNLYAIQPASLLGPYIITFVVAVFNYQVAYFVYHRYWKMLCIPIAVLLVYLGWGRYLYNAFETDREVAARPKPFKACILSVNLPPNDSWNRSNGNYIAGEMFSLAMNAAKGGAQLAIWSETAVPWTYEPNDDFIRTLDSLTAPFGLVHQLGINTAYQERVYYNSSYCIAPARKILGRYDKRNALSLAEKPWMGILLPFFTDNSFRVKEGTSDIPLNTPFGKAGMILCNESVVTQPTWSMVRNGAQFLVNQGNDGWFSGTYLSKQHYYYARLRAVETRKDIVINNNNGICGLVQASGNIVAAESNQTPKAIFVTVEPNNYRSDGIRYSGCFVAGAAIVFVLLSLLNRIKRTYFG
ncbi:MULTISPECIES: apolipoprotein N-acyltransferase [Chitinophagaceae]